MRIGGAPDIGRLLRALPDMEPPPDAWRKIRASQRRGHPAAWTGIAVAASMAVLAIILVTRDEAPNGPVKAFPRETLVVEAESEPRSSGLIESPSVSVADLRRRSQHMERMLRGIPKSPEVIRVDVAGAIADLQDRIAAVDYELSRSTGNRRVQESSAIVRWPLQNEAAFRPATQTGPPAGRDLWRQRVELMDRLVRARYAEVGAEAY